MIDVKHQISEVRRAVGSKVLEAGQARVITISQAYEGSLDDVWDACTNPERILRWFLPVSGDLRLGGTYQLEGNAGGEIRACEPPQRLLITWIAGPPPGPDDSSLVEVRLREEGGATRLELEHTAVVPAEFWDKYGPGAVGVGWDLALLSLAAHLEGGQLAASPAAAEADPEIQ